MLPWTRSRTATTLARCTESAKGEAGNPLHLRT